MRVALTDRIELLDATPQEVARVRALCEHPNPARVELPRLEAALRDRPFDRRLRGMVAALREQEDPIRTWRRLEGGTFTAPRGLLSQLRPIGDLVDRTSLGDPELRWPRGVSPRKSPRPEQEAFVAAAVRETQGIYRASAGSGKSLALLFLAHRLALPTLVCVPSQALLEQWVRVAIEDLGLRPEDVGAVGGGACDVRPLTVATVDSLAADGCRRARELSRTFGVLLFDEVYGAAARTRFDVVDCSAARYRIACGDDERRKDDLECLTYDAFGPVLCELSRRDAERMGLVVPVRVRLVETGTAPPAWWDKLDAQSRAMRRTELIRHLEEDPQRAALVASYAVRAAREGQVLVFGHHVDHVHRMRDDAVIAIRSIWDELDRLARADDLGGETERRLRKQLRELNRFEMKTGLFLGAPAQKAERRRTTEGLLDGSVRTAFATYKALGKGVNLPSVERAVLATPIHNSRDGVNQVLARLNRTAAGKAAPEAVVLYDERIFGLEPVRAYVHGGREVVVERKGGKITVPAREYLRDRQDERAKEKVMGAARFFDGL